MWQCLHRHSRSNLFQQGDEGVWSLPLCQRVRGGGRGGRMWRGGEGVCGRGERPGAEGRAVSSFSSHQLHPAAASDEWPAPNCTLWIKITSGRKM